MASSARRRRIVEEAPMLPGLVQDDVDTRFAGIVEDVLYSSANRSWLELMVRREDGLLAKVTGRGQPVHPGDEIEAEGGWVVDPKYGRRFEANAITGQFPDSTAGIVRYLSSGTIPGIGKDSAQKLAFHFGDGLPDVMERPTSLIAAGISEDKATKIARHWIQRTRYGQLLSVLFAHSMGEETAARIIEKYGESANKVIASDPYRLIRDIKGIGFKRADRIALSQNLDRQHATRLSAGILHVAHDISTRGDCCTSRQELVAGSADLLEIPERDIQTAVDRMINDGKLIADRTRGCDVLYEAGLHAAELEVTKRLTARLHPNPLAGKPEALVDMCATQVGFPLHALQRAAVLAALANQTTIVTGGPGTGKTSTLRVILECLEAALPDGKIMLTAPTGRAAQRMHESTGRPASTLHLALEARIDGFNRNADNQLKADVVIVDEASMLDIFLMRNLLRALPGETRLIFIGDADQLPSVGPGNVLADMIDSGVVPVTRLTEVYRQGAGSDIAVAARAIARGMIPIFHAPSKGRDNWTAIVSEPAQVIEKLKTLTTRVLPDLGFDPMADLQTITPGHGNETGTANLNKILQETLNPARAASVEFRSASFRRGDRVMHITNDKTLEVYNGNIGRIVDLHAGKQSHLVVDYDGHVVDYTRNDIENLRLAYAISVHKSQGSEARVVAPVLTTQHYILLKRNLYYTALTRARELAVTIGQKRAITIAVKTEGSRRLTGLAERLAAGFAPTDNPFLA